MDGWMDGWCASRAELFLPNADEVLARKEMECNNTKPKAATYDNTYIFDNTHTTEAATGTYEYNLSKSTSRGVRQQRRLQTNGQFYDTLSKNITQGAYIEKYDTL
uniref:Uncharacterized protein n=1 Tax=Grammatophora oceanica TaxID=210454 RepID=A0A7S1VQX0_9STRA|mmetsp:Transcript_51704/g.77165  ORF Transcript_51704/g.77165 Transcript_51704/m.77165 type:complete len:105 (+) Transcript_51704:1-315(+)